MSIPATAPTTQPEVPLYPPPVIMAPIEGDDHRRNDVSGPPQEPRRKPEKLPN
jgi:hypothetical protein